MTPVPVRVGRSARTPGPPARPRGERGEPAVGPAGAAGGARAGSEGERATSAFGTSTCRAGDGGRRPRRAAGRGWCRPCTRRPADAARTACPVLRRGVGEAGGGARRCRRPTRGGGGRHGVVPRARDRRDRRAPPRARRRQGHERGDATTLTAGRGARREAFSRGATRSRARERRGTAASPERARAPSPRDAKAPRASPSRARRGCTRNAREIVFPNYIDARVVPATRRVRRSVPARHARDSNRLPPMPADIDAATSIPSPSPPSRRRALPPRLRRVSIRARSAKAAPRAATEHSRSSEHVPDSRSTSYSHISASPLIPTSSNVASVHLPRRVRRARRARRRRAGRDVGSVAGAQQARRRPPRPPRARGDIRRETRVAGGRRTVAASRQRIASVTLAATAPNPKPPSPARIRHRRHDRRAPRASSRVPRLRLALHAEHVRGALVRGG